MSKFKVGDIVEVLPGNFESTEVNVGDLGVVQKVEYDVDTPVYTVRMDNSRVGVFNWLFMEASLKLVESRSVVNYHLLKDSVIFNYGGKTISIRRGDVRFDDAIACIRENRLQDVPSLIDTESAFAKQGLVLKDGLLELEGESLPESLSKRVLELVEQKLPIDIMLKFWQNLKQNPSFNSRKMLYDFLEHNGHPLTEDGCFIAYRGVTEDFKDKHTGKFDNKVGAVCEMNRSQVDDNPDNTCSSGLHVACFDYAKGFGPKLIEVKVNPKDVVAVPRDYNGTKMRVCRFEVVAEGQNLRDETVYGVSKQANVDDAYQDDESYV